MQVVTESRWRPQVQVTVLTRPSWGDGRQQDWEEDWLAQLGNPSKHLENITDCDFCFNANTRKL